MKIYRICTRNVINVFLKSKFKKKIEKEDEVEKPKFFFKFFYFKRTLTLNNEKFYKFRKV